MSTSITTSPTAKLRRQACWGKPETCFCRSVSRQWLPARTDLVLRFGLEIACAMALVQLSFGRPAGAVDHSPALDGRTLADFFRPARQVFVLVRLQELARVIVGGAV